MVPVGEWGGRPISLWVLQASCLFAKEPTCVCSLSSCAHLAGSPHAHSFPPGSSTLFWGSPYYHLHLLSPAPSCPSWVAAYGQAEACGSVAEHFHGLSPGVGQLIASPKSPTLGAAPSPPPLEQKVLEAAVGSLRPAEEQASSMGCCSPWAVELQEVMPAAVLAFSPCWGFCSCGWQQALSLSLLW